MANVQVNGGLVPYAPGGGGLAPNWAMTYYQIANNNSNKIFKGDPVKLLNTGFIDAWTAGTGVAQLMGIFWGCEFLSTVRGYTVSPFWPAAGDVASGNVVKAYVYPCNQGVPIWFLAQCDSTGQAFQDIGQNIDVVMGTGSTSTGLSAALLDHTTQGTAATLPFRIMRFYSDLGGLDNGSSGALSSAPTVASPFVKCFVAANVAGQAGL